MSVKSRVEAVLFASSAPLSVEELCKLTKSTPEDVKTALEEIKADLEAKQGALSLGESSDGWQLRLRQEFQNVLRGLGAKAELPKALMKTLAVTASKAPVLQSEIIKIRTNKAYGELSALEDMGFITREKKGRTRLIKLAPKFHEYFQVPETKLKERMAKAEERSTTEATVQEYEAKETYDQPPVPPPVEIAEDKLGELTVYKTTPVEAKGKEAEMLAGLEVYERKKRKHKPAPRHPRPRPAPAAPPAGAPAPAAGPAEEAGEAKPEAAAEEAAPAEATKPAKPSKAELEAAAVSKKEHGDGGLFREGMPEHVRKRVERRVTEMVTGKPAPAAGEKKKGAETAEGAEKGEKPTEAEEKKEEEKKPGEAK